MTTDREVLDRWWREFRATGQLPVEIDEVQTRLIRSVHRARLGSGEVFVKTMTFPRGKDRLRYLFRALPAAHEAGMLRHVAAAGIPCPEVFDVRVARRLGLPYRSWLVTRALPTADGGAPPTLAEQAELALDLLRAGIVHRDLHADNFLRRTDGRVAVLDLQSASHEGRARVDAGHRLAAAARLVRDLEDDAARGLLASELVADPAELEIVIRRAAAERADYARRRTMRCLLETTEFSRSVRWNGIEHRHRTAAPPGRWIHGGRELRNAWVGQRALHLFGSRSPLFWAFFQKWWWLGGGCALYVPKACSEERIELELAAAGGGVAMLAGRMQPNGAGGDGAGQQPREPGPGGG